MKEVLEVVRLGVEGDVKEWNSRFAVARKKILDAFGKANKEIDRIIYDKECKKT